MRDPSYTIEEEARYGAAMATELEGYKLMLDTVHQSGGQEDKNRLKEIGTPAPSFATVAVEGLTKCDVGGGSKAALQLYLNMAQPADLDTEMEVIKPDFQEAISFAEREARENPLGHMCDLSHAFEE